MLREPGERLLPRRVQHDPPLLEEENAVADLERPRGPLLREDDGHAETGGQPDERVRSLGIELGGRLVEQKQLRLERERGRQADALQLTGRELRDTPLEQMLGPERGEGRAHPRRDLDRRSADVLDAEGDLVLDAAEDDLVLRILEDGGDDAGEVGRPRPARVLSADLDASLEPAAVEMRDEPRQGAHERRLAGAGGAEDGDDLPGIELERDVQQRRLPPGIGEREAADGR